MAAGAEVFGEAAELEMNSPASAAATIAVEPLSPKTSNPSSEKNMEKNKNSDSEMSGESVVINGVKGSDLDSNADSKSEIQMKEIVDMLNKLKLNPLAKEFFPSSYYYGQMGPYNIVFSNKNLGNDGVITNRRKRNNNNSSKRRMSARASRAQREDSIRRTVYVSEIDHNITEERLAALFISCGQVVDCRVCGDPHSRLRFAFVEFADEYCAKAALSLTGTMLGFSPIKVLPSKTAILPVNPTFLPKSEDEREMCARTVYCTNIDKKVSQADVKNFFESRCGEVSRLRLLGDHIHSTRIAFVEFFMAESAILALDCCGEMLGTQHISEPVKDTSETTGPTSWNAVTGTPLSEKLAFCFFQEILLRKKRNKRKCS
ncbi:Polyadenylate-binding protein-interacting protein 8-like isoform X1 [Castilleja foliolosa]|uniref:Polyadenylate-binding protein-interacting protein 8-like isoform X1 n=1 Tax=Castilleja foliolosa TaxID=1961234 RepID=A0ABD3CNI1_9LAMI